MEICIMGGGNGAFAAAAHLGFKKHKICLFSPFFEELEPIQINGGLKLKGCYGNNFIKNIFLCKDIEQATKNAELIMIVVPAIAHSFYAKMLAPFLKEGQFIFLNPGHTGGALHVKNVLEAQGVKKSIRIGETNTLTYFARKTGFAEVSIWKETERIIFSALPASDTKIVKEKIQKLYPHLSEGKNVLETSLTNHNAILHPPAMVLNASYIERAGGDFCFYSEGTTQAVGLVMEDLDKERIELLRGFGLDPISFREDFYRGGYTTEEAYKSGSYQRLVKESPVNKSIRAPENLQHRFLEEDICCGLVPMVSLGVLQNLEMPVASSLITIAGSINRKNYFKEGINLDKLGFTGLSLEKVISRVN